MPLLGPQRGPWSSSAGAGKGPVCRGLSGDQLRQRDRVRRDLQPAGPPNDRESLLHPRSGWSRSPCEMQGQCCAASPMLE